ncbi:hypothetical protein CEXT_108821 [Caerostris extrusa]|uniref:Uncharacterized protein n=1 Tax=Caerostris extrusa TaxID=172846 RepID=A0AAV4R6T3_CAEEX|nr:hypothetical protein CEXT_108821 [Caerostris extrusa]
MSQRMGRDVPSRRKKEHYPVIVCFQFCFTTPMGDESVILCNTSRHGDGMGKGVPRKGMRSDFRFFTKGSRILTAMLTTYKYLGKAERMGDVTCDNDNGHFRYASAFLE